MANAVFTRAIANKEDEFYTQIGDIEKELRHYKKHFKGKTIFCNCDDPESSNFCRYFQLNFYQLGIKKLISTHYDAEKTSYKLEIVSSENGSTGQISLPEFIRTPLKQNGDFRSPECIEILKEADIVITNPPFSLFREYVAQLIEYEKKFLIIGNQNAITYKEIFALLKSNQIWLGYHSGDMEFVVPDHYEPRATRYREENGVKYRSLGNICWFTNLDIDKRHEDITLYRTYTPEDYPDYMNYDGVNCDKTKQIPMDYYGVIGVPITFMSQYNPEQFDIVGLGIVGSCEFTSDRKMEILDKSGLPTGKYTVNAKGTLYRRYNPEKDKKPAFKDCETGELYSSIYARILIRRKQQ